MLRHVMGDQKFFAALRQYVHKYHFGQVDTASFEKICEAEYGKSLDWFFKQWIYGVGRPIYSLSWRVKEGASPATIVVTLNQEQPELFAMPIDLTLEGGSGQKTISVWNDQKTQQYTLPLSGELKGLVLDSGGWILKGTPTP